MPILVDKMLTAFISPVGITLVLGLVAVALLRVGRQRLASLMLVVSLVLLWAFSTPLVARLLLSALENQNAAADRNAKADVAILLGGMLEEPEASGEPGVSGAVDRALHAARLYRAGRVRFILVSAGNLPWQETLQPEAEQIAFLLEEWGIPRSALIIEGQSRNTFENAVRSKPIWDARGFRSGLLVTSAFHMPRALAVFRHAGFDVVPEPADFHVGPRLEGGVLTLFPDASALAESTIALKEWIGLLVYRLRGWA